MYISDSHPTSLESVTVYISDSHPLESVTVYISDSHPTSLTGQFVQIMGCKSESLAVSKGVPQGSVLRPVLFLILLNHYHPLHTVSTKPTASLRPSMIIACLHDIILWMTEMYLKLNGDKTELLVVGSY